MVLNHAIFVDTVNTSAGVFQVLASGKGLTGINFPSRHRSIPKKRSTPRRVQKILNAARSYLTAFFNDRQPKSNYVSIDWNNFAPFDRRVLQALCRVPAGATISYGALAERAGNPKGARAVGNALNRNPIPILLPCHRVVRKNGSIGGYSGGQQLKRNLLELERSRKPSLPATRRGEVRPNSAFSPEDESATKPDRFRD